MKRLVSNPQIRSGLLLLVLGVRLSVVAAAFAVSAFAHPTDRELRDSIEERRLCESSLAVKDRLDPVQLGMTEVEMRSLVEGLREETSPDGEGSSRGQGLQRFVRKMTDGLSAIEYELWQEQVYRIRWRLSATYERPVLDEYGRWGQICFGAPDVDQTFEAEPGSTKATLRRIRWAHGDRQIELRQLHPLRGGAVYLTVTTPSILRKMGEAGVANYPDPNQSAAWWRRPKQIILPASDEERKRLGREFVGILSQIDH